MIYFIADTHFGHAKIAATRGFDDHREHDMAVVKAINETVSRTDRLVICGDFCWKHPQTYRQRITCKDVWLIFGNHDKQTWGRYFTRGTLGQMFKLPSGLQVWASHYPHAYWPSSHHGAAHVYGHCHSQREGTLNDVFPDRRSLDVGVDNLLAWTGKMAPVSGEWLDDWFKYREGHDKLSYYRNPDNKNGRVLPRISDWSNL